MKTIKVLTVPVVAVALAAGCGSYSQATHPTTTILGSGLLVREAWPVGGFAAVAVSGAGHLVIERTGHESLEITAGENILPLLRAEVRGGRLILGPRPGTEMSPTREILYRLTVRELSDIEASGATGR